MSLRDHLGAANTAACTVADEGRAAPQRHRDGFSLPSVQDDQPGNVAPSPPRSYLRRLQ
ncbi:MAG TPA: hypothetical protein VJT72_14635 [Pseudonocardiaceae bacterium]|nr:hypothetical protein [Pseudonocardiaceae bacterium]